MRKTDSFWSQYFYFVSKRKVLFVYAGPPFIQQTAVPSESDYFWQRTKGSKIPLDQEKQTIYEVNILLFCMKIKV